MKFHGVFEPPGDKSISHRIALVSLLARGECAAWNYSTALDCMTSLQAVRSLGGHAVFQNGTLRLRGAEGNLRESATVDCGNSGTTMRLLMGILAGTAGRFTLVGDDSLMKRPMERAARPLREMGGFVACGEGGVPPIAIVGSRLTGIQYTLPTPSAQLKSAVLLAGTQADGRTELIEPVKSRDHTERLLKLCRARLYESANAWIVEKSDLHLPSTFSIPGDPSSAAFFLGAAGLSKGSVVTARGMLLNQTRIKYLEKYKEMGMDVDTELRGDIPEPWGNATVRYRGRLQPVEVEPHEMPLLIDEIPMLALLATQAHGKSLFHNISELRIKESDRVAALASELGRMGAHIEIVGNDMAAYGPTPLRAAGLLRSFDDHRIAMTLAVACAISGVSSDIDNPSCMAVSYPAFLRTMAELTK
uniref:3-phosphoshikimate 1-carboxyvinyltransferase n=1 Tax=Desulfomonile tiedjei TaxID=2358 RepID=A0A7C4EV55_9BACT